MILIEAFSKLAKSAALRRAINQVGGVSARIKEPFNSLLRKPRLWRFGRPMGARLPEAEILFRIDCGRPECAPYVATSYGLVESFARSSDVRPLGTLLRPTATLIDLKDYSDIAGYRKAVSKVTKGKYIRSENKARRLGFTSRPMAWDAMHAGRYAIRSSKLVRSKGYVWEAVAGPRPDLFDKRTPFATPECAEHWRIDWGAFRETDSEEQLYAYASLQRAGNAVHLLAFMGHAEALRDGVTKLLHFDILGWLLARKDPLVCGLRYLAYGNIEEGNLGLVDWKRYCEFEPRFLALSEPPPPLELRDFNARDYLRLNPDLSDLGITPWRHYLWHGMLEGRRYKD